MINYFDTSKSPYYIKGDNATDNGPGFRKLQKAMSASKQDCLALLPSGVILSSFTRWTHKVRRFKALGFNTTLKSIYTVPLGEKPDEAQERGLFPGEMMQNNVIEYNGKKEYVIPDVIQTARAGDKFITSLKPANYKAGERIFIGSGDLFPGGYPRACRDFDWIEAEEINGNIITLKMPLTENFFDYDRPEIFSLDRVENPYCDHAEFEGIAFEGNFAYPAMKLILTNCNVTGWLWISECREVFTNNVYAGKIEADKLVKRWIDNGLRTPSSPANGGSIYSIEMNNAETGSIRLCPRYLTLNNPKPWANKVIKDEEKQEFDYAIPCIADAPARCPIRRRTINQATFTSGSESQADKNMEFAPFEKIIIGQDGVDIDKVDSTTDIVLPSWKPASKLEAGTLLNNENGTNGGIVKQVMKVGDRYWLEGTWDQPTPGEKWLWSHVKEVIDNGGHRALNGKINYGPQSKRWQGNTSTGDVKEMHLTEADFTGPNPEIIMNCWIISIESIISKSGKGIEIANHGKLDEETGKNDYRSIYKMQYNVGVLFPIWSKYIDLIGFGGRFEIVLKWKHF